MKENSWLILFVLSLAFGRRNPKEFVWFRYAAVWDMFDFKVFVLNFTKKKIFVIAYLFFLTVSDVP